MMSTTNFLKITFSENLDSDKIIDETEYRNKPFINSQVFCAQIENFKELTQGTDVKDTYRLDLSLQDIDYKFLPGDSIAILPENNEVEVNHLLLRLNLENSCDKKYSLEILKDTKKKNAIIPKHLPPNGTLRNIFIKHIDIRTAPKKLFLKAILKYTKDPNEKEKLETIISPSGSQKYIEFVEEHRTLLTLLNALPSCDPPIELILEHSTPLNPRYFSIASSPLETDILSIIFSVVEFENGLKGICTGWLQKLLQKQSFKETKVPFYFRKPGDFRFTNMETPSILVATGTGVAPYRGFLQHLNSLRNSCSNLPATWLFYGCRYSSKDFLCQDEIENHLKVGALTKLYTAFSRDTEKKVYVQQRIVECGKEIVDLILNQGATIYVCGDVKTVVKDVREVIIRLFKDHTNVDRQTAEDIVNNLVKSKKYLVDTWN